MPRMNELMPWGREGFGFPLTSVQEDMNRLFDNFYNGSQLMAFGALSAPSVNVSEDSKSIKVEAELAGIDPKNVDVEIMKGSMTLKGERQQEENKEDKNYIRREISYGSFTRTVALPETADGDKAKATFKNGLLTIEIPKVQEAQQKSKKVEIKTGA